MGLVPTSLADILLALQAKVADDTGLPLERVQLTGRDDLNPQNADQYVAIRPLSAIILQPFETGTGRTWILVTRRLRVYIRSRLSVDAASDDTAWLTDSTYGIIPLEEKVLNSLQEYLPEDGSGDGMVSETIKFIAQPSGQDKDAPHGTPPDGWGETSWDLSVTYTPPAIVRTPDPPDPTSTVLP